MQNTTYTGVLFAPRRHGAHAHSYDGSGDYDDDGGRCRDDEVEGLEDELDGLLVGQVEGREESMVDGGVGVWIEEGARVVLGDEDTAEGEAGLLVKSNQQKCFDLEPSVDTSLVLSLIHI